MTHACVGRMRVSIMLAKPRVMGTRGGSRGHSRSHREWVSMMWPHKARRRRRRTRGGGRVCFHGRSVPAVGTVCARTHARTAWDAKNTRVRSFLRRIARSCAPPPPPPGAFLRRRSSIKDHSALHETFIDPPMDPTQQTTPTAVPAVEPTASGTGRADSRPNLTAPSATTGEHAPCASELQGSSKKRRAANGSPASARARYFLVIEVIIDQQVETTLVPEALFDRERMDGMYNKPLDADPCTAPGMAERDWLAGERRWWKGIRDAGIILNVRQIVRKTDDIDIVAICTYYDRD